VSFAQKVLALTRESRLISVMPCDRFYLVTNAGRADVDLPWIQSQLEKWNASNDKVEMKVLDDAALIALQGESKVIRCFPYRVDADIFDSRSTISRRSSKAPPLFSIPPKTSHFRYLPPHPNSLPLIFLPTPSYRSRRLHWRRWVRNFSSFEIRCRFRRHVVRTRRSETGGTGSEGQFKIGGWFVFVRKRSR